MLGIVMMTRANMESIMPVNAPLMTRVSPEVISKDTKLEVITHIIRIFYVVSGITWVIDDNQKSIKHSFWLVHTKIITFTQSRRLLKPSEIYEKNKKKYQILTVIIRRPECIFCDGPPGREYYEVGDSGSWLKRRTGEHCEYRRILNREPNNNI